MARPSVDDIRPGKRDTIPTREIDDLVLGTINAPYKRSIGARELVDVLTSARSGEWMVHVATFFTDVRPELVLKFGKLHGMSASELAFAYRKVKETTGETNRALETLFEQLAPTA